MSLFDSPTLRTAEALERSTTGDGGARFALPVYKQLLTPGADPSLAARAALGALRCAARIVDERELPGVAAYWSTLPAGGAHFPAILELCRKLARLGPKGAALALTLARAEAERAETARALYLLGRCLEAVSDAEGAFVAFGRAAARADEEKGAADVATAARVRRIERLLGERSPAELVLVEATAADPAVASSFGKLMIARGRLLSPSRFVRASGLSLLEELGRDPTTSLGALAIGHAAEHADALGDALTPLEADRIGAALRHVPDDAARESALARLAAAQVIAASRGEAQADAIQRAAEVAPEIAPLVRRARALLAGGREEAPRRLILSDLPSSPPLRLVSFGLAALEALGDGRARDAAEALSAARVFLGGIVDRVLLPSPLWTAARVALESAEPSAQKAGAELCGLLLSAPSAAPPRGFSGFAAALARAGRADLAAGAARKAAARKEPGARELLGSILREQGWARAAAGEREQAIAALTEAKGLLTEVAQEKQGARGR
ncbi:hypothetical protein [Polyangium spumosum]|uniref:Uncharacterized protein n=1 Tax=Polyangium spumosum TaxID=889282 RepID=A0A6N7Q6U7_9BACT|nr:hypothetical protein [Polyangium spumosum]MRG96611.1 hypothetical protein [Polyangium spumosum]